MLRDASLFFCLLIQGLQRHSCRGENSCVGRRLDALIVRTVPGVRKAVKWSSPFFGIEGRGWFLSFHCFTYIKVAFFRGTSLRPVPPGASKHKDVRYLDIYEDDQLTSRFQPGMAAM